jgi:hypothetical protein
MSTSVKNTQTTQNTQKTHMTTNSNLLSSNITLLFEIYHCPEDEEDEKFDFTIYLNEAVKDGITDNYHLKYFPTNRWLEFKCYTDRFDGHKYGEIYIEADKHNIHSVKYRNVNSDY